MARQTSLLVGCVSRACGSRFSDCGEAARLAPQGELGKVWTYSHISAGVRLFPLKLTSFSLQKRDTSAPLASLHEKTFYAQPGRLCPGSPTKKRDWKTKKKPGKDLSALLFLLCTVWVESFSCSNLTDVTGCVLPNPEVCVSGNRAAPPTGRGAQCKAHTSTTNQLKMQLFLF